MNYLVFTVMAIQPDISEAKQYVFDKLSIEQVDDAIKLELSRPYYAKTAHYDVLSGDDEDETKYWRLAGTAKEIFSMS